MKKLVLQLAGLAMVAACLAGVVGCGGEGCGQSSEDQGVICGSGTHREGNACVRNVVPPAGR